MAFQARFVADFSQWDQALANAKKNVHAFEVSTAGLQQKLQSAVNAFDGTKLQAQAKIAAAAIERIGGPAKLTETELRRANSTLSEAIAKYDALGQKAPVALQKTADEVRGLVDALDQQKAAQRDLEREQARAKGATDAHGLSFGKLVASYVTAQAVWSTATGLVRGVAEAFLDAATSTIALGDKLSNMSAATGMSVEGLQKLQYATAASGVSLETLSNASLELGRRLAEGDKSAVGAIQKLGLSLNSFKAMAPDEQILAVNEALLKMGTQAERNAVAADLFGKAWKTLAPALQADLKGLGDEAERMGIVLDQATVDAIDNFGDMLDAASIAASGMKARFFVPLLEEWDRLNGAMSLSAINLGDWAETAGRVFTNLARSVSQARNSAEAAFAIGAALSGGAWNRAFDETQRAKIDRSRKAFADLGEELKGLMHSSQGLPLPPPVDERATKAAGAAMKQLREEQDRWTGQDLVKRANDLTATYLRLNRTLPATAAMQRTVNQALAAAVPILGQIPPAMTELLIRTLPVVEQFQHGLPQGFETVGRKADEMRRPLGLLIEDLRRLEKVTYGIPDGLLEIGRVIDKMPPPKTSLVDKIIGKDFGKQLGAAIMGAIQGGGDVGRAVGQLIGQRIGDLAGEAIGKQLGSALGKTGLGKQLGEKLGSAIGEFAGPIIGTLLGAGISQVIDKLLKTEAQKVNDLRDQFLLQFGPGGTGPGSGFDTLAKQLHQLGAAGDAMFNRIIKAGTEKRFNAAVAAATRELEKFRKELEGILAIGERGELLNPEMVRTLSGIVPGTPDAEQLGRFFQQQTKMAADGIGGWIQARGDLAKQLRDAQQKLGAAIAAGDSSTTIAQLNAEVDRLNKQLALMPLNTQNAEAFGAALVGIFADLQLQGASPLEALQVLGSSITSLQDQLAGAGLSGGEAFAELGRLAALAGGEFAAPLQAVNSLGKGLAALQNTGLLTQSMFAGLAGTVAQTFNNLVAQGANGQDALRLMQPTLQTIWQLQKDFGYEVDAATQKLLDEAEAGGIVGDKFRPAADRMAAAIEKLISRLDTLITQLTGGVPRAGDDAARGLDRTLGSYRPPTMKIPVVFEFPEGAAPDQITFGVPARPYASGGVVFRPQGTDTVPAMLTPGEFVISRPAAARAGADVLHAINRGESPARTVNVSLQVDVKALDGADVEQVLLRRVVPTLRRLIRADAEHIGTGLRSDLRVTA